MALAPCGARTWRPFILDACRHAPHATYPGGGPETALEGFPSHRPYSVLLPVGFAVPLLLPVARWALTPPFHPCRSKCRGGLLSVALSLGLPPPAISRYRVSMEPGLSSPAAFRLRGRGRPASWQARIKGFAPENANEKANACRPKVRSGLGQRHARTNMHCPNPLRNMSVRQANRAPPSAPSPCCNRRPRLDSSASPHGRHCI